MEEQQKPKEETESKETPKEKMEQQEFRNITIYHMHKDVVTEFKQWCKIHAGNKFPAGIDLLLSRAKMYDSLTQVETRLAAVEQQLAMLLPGKKSAEEHSEKTEVKTIGGAQHGKQTQA